MNTETPVRAALLENLIELHLPTMRACFEDTARRAEQETLSYEQYLLELTERECEARELCLVKMLSAANEGCS